MWHSADAELSALCNHRTLDSIASPNPKYRPLKKMAGWAEVGKTSKRTPKIQTHAESITAAVKSSFRAFISI